jgi:fucose permease
MVVGRFSGDWVAVKLGKTKQLKYCVVMATVGLAIACLIDIVPLVFIALTVSGVGISILFPALYDAAAQDPQRPSAALGAVTAGSRGITLIAPISIGLLADTSVSSVGMAMAVFALPCLLTMAYLAKRNHIF